MLKKTNIRRSFEKEETMKKILTEPKIQISMYVPKSKLKKLKKYLAEIGKKRTDWFEEIIDTLVL